MIFLDPAKQVLQIPLYSLPLLTKKSSFYISPWSPPWYLFKGTLALVCKSQCGISSHSIAFGRTLLFTPCLSLPMLISNLFADHMLLAVAVCSHCHFATPGLLSGFDFPSSTNSLPQPGPAKTPVPIFVFLLFPLSCRTCKNAKSDPELGKKKILKPAFRASTSFYCWKHLVERTLQPLKGFSS